MISTAFGGGIRDIQQSNIWLGDIALSQHFIRNPINHPSPIVLSYQHHRKIFGSCASESASTIRTIHPVFQSPPGNYDEGRAVLHEHGLSHKEVLEG